MEYKFCVKFNSADEVFHWCRESYHIKVDITMSVEEKVYNGKSFLVLAPIFNGTSFNVVIDTQEDLSEWVNEIINYVVRGCYDG